MLQGLDESLRISLEDKWIGKCGFSQENLQTQQVEGGVEAILDLQLEEDFIKIEKKNDDDDEDQMQVDDQDDEEEQAFQPLGKEVKSEIDPLKIDIWILNFEEIKRRVEVRNLMQGIECEFIREEKLFKGKERQRDEMDLDDLNETEQEVEEENSSQSQFIDEELLNPLIKNVGGYLLPRMISDSQIEETLFSKNGIEMDQRIGSSSSSSSSFIETSTLSPILSQMALFYSLKLPILLTGTSSSGKSSLIEYFYSLLQPSLPSSSTSASTSTSSILTLQLSSSSLDPTSLLGSFVSSPINLGQFEWSEGSLTRAVRKGMWIVLEDIDKANSESLSMLNSLIKQFVNKKDVGKDIELDLGGNRGSVKAGKGFRIWATRSLNPTNDSRKFPNPSFLNWNSWSEIQLNEMNRSDIVEILNQTCPTIASIDSAEEEKGDTPIERIVSTWEMMKNSSFQNSHLSVRDSKDNGKRKGKDSIGSGGTKRNIGLRDLLKWARRIENLLGDGNSSSVKNQSKNGNGKGKDKDKENVKSSSSSGNSKKIKNGKEGRRDPFGNQVIQEEVFLEACDVFLGNMAET